MYSFNSLKPGSIKEEESLLSGSNDNKVNSVGMTLLPTLKQRLARIENLIGLENNSISLEYLFGLFFSPLAWLMGINSEDV